MRFTRAHLVSVVFFCSTGLIYSGPALGVSAEDEAEAWAQIEAQAEIVEPVATTAEIEAPAAPAPGDTAPASTALPAESLFAGTAPAAAPEAGQEKLPQGQSVNVGSFGTVELHVKDAELTQVLQLLSIQSQRNIVATRSVAGSVTADLYGVDFYEALDAILRPNGFGYIEKGNFIYVYTIQEIEAEKERNRRLASRLVRLNYITARDAAGFIDPLKSPAGSFSMTNDTAAGFQASESDGGADGFAHGAILVIRDYQEHIDDMVAVLADLDVRPKQVLVEASILQARLTENNAWGVDLTVLGDFAMSEFTSPLTVVDQLISGTGPTTSGGAAQTTVGSTAVGPAGAKVGIVSKHIAAFIKALDSVTDTTVLANPKLLVLNRQRAHLLVGERLGYISTTQTDTAATSSVQFLPVGTELSLRPFISDEGYVRMELRPSISDGETRTVGGFVIPNESTHEITTNIMVRSGQTIVLGGLFKEDTTVSRSQVPFLGSVPILGAAFQGRNDTVVRSEVIFMIKPTIMRDEVMAATVDFVRDNFDRAHSGNQRQLLPWSRTKLTTAHMRDAMAAYDAGRTDKALWHANVALYLDPTYAEAMRLKQQITGEQIFLLDRSILNKAVDLMVHEQIGAAPNLD